MNKVVGIAMLTFLACGQVQIVMSESIQAQTTQARKAEADRLLQQGNQQYQIRALVPLGREGITN